MRPPAATEINRALLFAILRFHFLHLLQELLQHRPRLRASTLLEPIERLGCGRGPSEAAGRAKLDPMHLRQRY